MNSLSNAVNQASERPQTATEAIIERLDRAVDQLGHYADELTAHAGRMHGIDPAPPTAQRPAEVPNGNIGEINARLDTLERFISRVGDASSRLNTIG